jgi:hypothetical protein
MGQCSPCSPCIPRQYHRLVEKCASCHICTHIISYMLAVFPCLNLNTGCFFVRPLTDQISVQSLAQMSIRNFCLKKIFIMNFHGRRFVPWIYLFVHAMFN